jgi:hypothetical protein
VIEDDVVVTTVELFANQVRTGESTVSVPALLDRSYGSNLRRITSVHYFHSKYDLSLLLIVVVCKN